MKKFWIIEKENGGIFEEYGRPTEVLGAYESKYKTVSTAVAMYCVDSNGKKNYIFDVRK